MNKPYMQFAALAMTAAVTFTNFSIDSYASSNKVTSVLPQAGITYALGNNQVSLSNLQETVETEKVEEESTNSTSAVSILFESVESDDTVTNVTPMASTVTDSILSDIQNATGAVIGSTSEEVIEGEEVVEDSEEELFKTLVIAKVNDYVNVRDLPDERHQSGDRVFPGLSLQKAPAQVVTQYGSTQGFCHVDFTFECFCLGLRIWIKEICTDCICQYFKSY